MGMPFNADEVLEMAERIERNGSAFYRAAAVKFPDAEDVLLDLAAMEDEHEKTFAAMRAELSEGQQEPLVFDPDDQVHMYLQAMADEHIFNPRTGPAEQLAGIQDTDDLLKFAIGIERDSIAFYVGLKDAVSHRAGKDKVEAVIKEEISHIAILNKKLTNLTG